MTAPFEPHQVQRSSTAVERVHRPRSIEAALEMLHDRPLARAVAGGTDLMVDLSRTEGPPVELVDLSAILGFRSIEVDESSNRIRFGGGVTHNDVLRDARVVDRVLPLAQACLEIGSPQLRNRATIAGNLATASPANDSISALMALGAEVELARLGTDGIVRRRVPVAEFLIGFRQTVLRADELIIAVSVPCLTAGQRGIWVKLGLRKAQAISVVHAGLVIDFGPGEPGPDATIVDARIALGSVAATVVVSEACRRALIGHTLDTETIERAARAARDDVAPIDDGRATAEYRSVGVETMVGRALRSVSDGSTGWAWPKRVPTLGHATPPPVHHEAVDDACEIAVTIDGVAVSADGAAGSTLLDWLRRHHGTGTKEGCAEGECGACTVMLDGGAVMSCLVPAAQADGSTITTVAGLADGERLSEMQRSFVDEFAVQCGYCIPGFVVAASALANEFSQLDRSEVEFALAGNLCRCTGYYAILSAVDAALGRGGP